MQLNRVGLAGLLLAGCLAAVSLAGGCAGGGAGTTIPSIEAGPQYPDWVRIVPAPNDQGAQYVGGCLSAVDLAAGIEEARADALEQLAAVARDRFIDLFEDALLETRTTTASMDRYRFRTDGVQAYVDKLAEAVVLQDSYYRPCPDATREGPVCDVFVLLSLTNTSRDAALFETLERFRATLRSEGNLGMAEIAERMERAVRAPEPSE